MSIYELDAWFGYANIVHVLLYKVNMNGTKLIILDCHIMPIYELDAWFGYDNIVHVLLYKVNMN